MSSTFVDCFAPSGGRIAICEHCKQNSHRVEDTTNGRVVCTNCGFVESHVWIDDGNHRRESYPAAKPTVGFDLEDLATEIERLCGPNRPKVSAYRRQLVANLTQNGILAARKHEGIKCITDICARVNIPAVTQGEAIVRWSSVCKQRMLRKFKKREYCLEEFCCAIIFLCCIIHGNATRPRDFVPHYITIFPNICESKPVVTVPRVRKAIRRVLVKYPDVFRELTAHSRLMVYETRAWCRRLCNRLDDSLWDKAEMFLKNYHTECRFRGKAMKGDPRILAGALFHLVAEEFSIRKVSQDQIATVLGLPIYHGQKGPKLGTEVLSRRKRNIREFFGIERKD